ncbi:diacylglycerol/lipid kinase family protein [Geomonas anaerohicana]|uniref:YegS/Rv2252/BmrU family lipid kinase n=1 Tax=Geomonas anaerohicana TaxID=2798583 RepID=A0ABS0YF16_9BACT|nr:YegS/Rv2252/BmrU family lipid kinase [Geomonas anaerohicana]MBJ6750908.1 YegS/Rv2252/BmrU family lipid kinase [Geomonas anaerohicana]
MSRRCFLIVNPTSGTYSQQKVERIMTGLTERGLAPELLPTQSAADPARFAARICAEESEPFIVVAGGDGTINGVLNGLAPGAATLGVVPLGTSNVLARELEIESVDDALDRLARGETRPISVGEIVRGGERRRFLLMAGAGFDGAVVRDVRLSEKRTLGKGAYVLSALRTFWNWDGSQLSVSGGGRSVSCHGVIVCNASKYGGNFVLAPEADLFAPGFQVLCISGGRMAYLGLALGLLNGTAVFSSHVTSFCAASLEITGDKAVQLDGDYVCPTPLAIRSVPDLVQLVV